MKQTNQQKSEMEWEEDFKEIIIPVGQFLATNDYFDYVKRMKDFIRQLLSQSRQQLVGEILRELEEVKNRFRCGACDGAKCEHTQCCQALKLLKTKLNKE